MMMSRNSVTSYFVQQKAQGLIHSLWHKSGSNLTKVIELHKTKISDRRVRPEKDLSKQWKGRCHLPPALSIWAKDHPSLLCLWRAEPQQGLQQPFCHSLWYICLVKKRVWDQGKLTWWGHPKRSHREDQIPGFYCDANLSQSDPGQRTGLLWASLPGQRAGTQIAVNVLEMCSLFDTCPSSLTNIAAPSREALAASDIVS